MSKVDGIATQQLREAVVAKKPAVTLTGEVECDEVYGMAGHKGQPDAIKSDAPASCCLRQTDKMLIH